jgi:hypothetical protein
LIVGSTIVDLATASGTKLILASYGGVAIEQDSVRLPPDSIVLLQIHEKSELGTGKG